MARVTISPKNMLERVGNLNARILQWSTFSDESMKTQNGKSWSGIEIIQHMILAQDAYSEKMDSVLQELSDSKKKIQSVEASWVPSFLIKRFPPKEDKVKFKMKTLKRFSPLLSKSEIENADVKKYIGELKNSLKQLEGWIQQSENKNVSEKKFSSAIGPMVKFNVLEACEFILCHNERHFHQLEKSLAKIIR